MISVNVKLLIKGPKDLAFRNSKITKIPVSTYNLRAYLLTRRMIVTAAIGSTVWSSPAKIAFTFVIWRFAAISINASLVTGLSAVLLAITVETTFALAAEATVSIGAERVRMAVVQAKIAFIYVRALRVRPAGLVTS